MRLLSMRLRDDLFAGGSAQLDLASLSALWGPNDAGKTTVLLRVHDVLGWLTGRAPPLVVDAIAVSDIIVELTSREADRFAGEAARDLDEKSPQPLYVGDGVASVSMARPSRERDAVVRALRTGEPALSPWIDLCLAHAALEEGQRRALRDAMTRRPVLRLAARGGSDCTWTASWAVESTVLLGLSLRPPDDSRWLGMVQAHGSPVGSAALPTPVAAGPGAWEPLADWLVECTTALGKRLAPAEDTGDEHVARVVLGALAVVSAAVARRTPDFVPDRYTLRVVANAGHKHLELAVVDGEGRSFSPGRLAEGYQRWLQLALTDVIEQLETLADALEHAYEDDAAYSAAWTVAGVLTHSAPGPPEIEEAVRALEAVERTWAAARQSDEAMAWVADPLQAALERTPRMYVIDEPERHLHPALQRQAADWMRVRATEPAVQFLYASHTPPMLGVPGDVSLIQVRRTGRGIELRSLDPRALRATDVEIKELGLDRGELLAFYRAVLFVEGETDKAVLEELYADRLRDIGLLVQPFRGANKVEKIVEAETLLRVMGPPFHVLVDNCPTDALAHVLSLDLPALVAALTAKPAPFVGELAFVARIRRSALEEGRDVRVHAISQKDILGVLDQDCILEVQRELKPDGPRWPGFAALVAQSGDNYNDRLPKYGILKNPEPFRCFARAMRDRGATSPELDAILDAIWRTTNQL